MVNLNFDTNCIFIPSSGVQANDFIKKVEAALKHIKLGDSGGNAYGEASAFSVNIKQEILPVGNPIVSVVPGSNEGCYLELFVWTGKGEIINVLSVRYHYDHEPLWSVANTLTKYLYNMPSHFEYNIRVPSHLVVYIEYGEPGDLSESEIEQADELLAGIRTLAEVYGAFGYGYGFHIMEDTEEEFSVSNDVNNIAGSTVDYQLMFFIPNTKKDVAC